MLCIISDISNYFLYPFQEKKTISKQFVSQRKKPSKLQRTEQSLWKMLIYLCSLGMCFGTDGFCIVHIWFLN